MRRNLLLASVLLLGSPVWAQPLPPPPSGGALDLTLTGPNVPGRFYGPIITAAPTASAVGAANRITAVPVYIRAGSVLKTLSINITTGNAAAWNARLCLYADNGQGLPGALLSDPGTLAVASGSVVGVQTSTIAGGGIAAGGAWYWVTFNTDNNGESISSAGAASVGSFSSSRLFGWSAAANAPTTNTAMGVYAAQTFGACPATFPAPTFGDNLPLPYIIMGY